VEKQYVIPDKKVEGVMKRATVWAKRVDSMVAEWKAPTEENYSMEGNNYQRTIAVIAVAHGGASPLGVGPGNSTERKFLPQAFADYIFAIFAEEWGIIGSIVLILLYLAILFRSVVISRKYADFAAMLMVMGLALMLTCQALISMMVSVGLGPVTGQPLPLISRGGTSAVITCIYFGIIMCVAREQNQLRSREEESIRDSLNNAPIIDIKE
jgi:cell division protein FtsW